MVCQSMIHKTDPAGKKGQDSLARRRAITDRSGPIRDPRCQLANENALNQ